MSYLLALVLAMGQPGTITIEETVPPVYVMPCHQWAVMVDTISSMGMPRFMSVFDDKLTKIAKQFAYRAYQFVEANKLQNAKGEIAYTMAMLECDGYRML